MQTFAAIHILKISPKCLLVISQYTLWRTWVCGIFPPSRIYSTSKIDQAIATESKGGLPFATKREENDAGAQPS
jgi:hypothetical protein